MARSRKSPIQTPVLAPVPDEQIKRELSELWSSEMLSSDSATKSQLKIWKALFRGISPKKLYETLQKEAGGNSTVNLELLYNKTDADEPEMQCTVFIDPKDAEKPIEKHAVKYTFAVPDDGASHDDIRLDSVRVRDSDQQGKRLLAGSLSKMVGMIKEQGTKNITTVAIQVGAYAWAKYGFRPADKEAWEELKEDIKMRIENGNPSTICMPYSWNTSGYAITDKAKKAIQKVLRSDEPADIIHLTELDEVVGKNGDHNITVGKALLLDAQWEGILPLDEKDRGYRQFLTYTGTAQEKDKKR